MPDNIQNPSRLGMDNTRKIERRRSDRPLIVPLKEDVKEEENNASSRLRPEAIAIALMVIALLILTAFAI